jgi:hypothetical protein
LAFTLTESGGMTPNDLDAYLRVFLSHSVAAAALKLPDGAEIHVTFVPKFEIPTGASPEPGGWKGLPHLDNPADLRDDGEHRGDLPT